MKDEEAWCAAVREVAKSWTPRSNGTMSLSILTEVYVYHHDLILGPFLRPGKKSCMRLRVKVPQSHPLPQQSLIYFLSL